MPHELLDLKKLKPENKTPKKILIFFPRNPYPFTDGNLKRFQQTLEAFLERGSRVCLLSANFFNGPAWNEESIRALKEMGVESVWVYRMSSLERKICGRFRKKRKTGRGKLFDKAEYNPIFMGFWFWLKSLHFKPDIVMIHYAWWSNFSSFFKISKILTVVEMHDNLTVNRLMRKELEEYLSRDILIENDLDKIPDKLFDEDHWDCKRTIVDPDEVREYQKFDYVLAISAQEAALVKKNAPAANVVFIPYSQAIASSTGFERKFVLFSAGRHPFNIHACLFFIKKIWPILKRSCADFQLKISGALKGRVFAPEGIEFLDFQKDMGVLYAQSRFVICPVIAGTGQVIKVVDAMSFGLPVVATRFAARGSGLIHEQSGYVANTPLDFAFYMEKLWKDPELCLKMGLKAEENSLQHLKSNPLHGFIEEILGKQ